MYIKVHIDKANSLSRAGLTLSSETKKINFALTDRQTLPSQLPIMTSQLALTA